MGPQQFQDQLWWQPSPSKGLGPTWFYFSPTSKPKSNQLLNFSLLSWNPKAWQNKPNTCDSFKMASWETLTMKFLSSTYWTINCCLLDPGNLMPRSLPSYWSFVIITLRAFPTIKNKGLMCSPCTPLFQCQTFKIVCTLTHALTLLKEKILYKDKIF
jgi:hypothetical protein